MRSSKLRTNELDARLLSNGSYSVLLSSSGGGFSEWKGTALTRWSADRTLDGEGLFFYLRDLDDGTFWSTTARPIAASAKRYRASANAGRVTFVRTDHGVEARTEVCITADADAEARLLTLRNDSKIARRIEVTSYLELALAEPAAFAAHPTFRQLFVQTEIDEASGTLLAHRRPRAADESPLWVAHALSGAGHLQWETDRARFIGRGLDLERPLALSNREPLSGSVGSVLDPIFSLRHVVHLKPGQMVRVVGLLVAAETRDAALDVTRRFRGEDGERVFALAAVAEKERRREVGLSDAAAERRSALAAARLYGDPRASADAAVPPPSRRRAKRRVAYQPLTNLSEDDAWSDTPDLLFDNGFGGFHPGGSKYVVRLPPAVSGPCRPPLPWVNVVANESFGFLVSESGAGCTWSRNSRENRLTPWSNDPIRDPHEEALYVRDEERAVFWSPLPGPCAAPNTYEAIHGFGYSRWRHSGEELAQQTCFFVARSDPMKLMRLRLTNHGRAKRRLSVFCYLRLVLGTTPVDSGRYIETWRDPATGAIFARNPARGVFSDGICFASGFASSGAEAVHVTTDREAFLGRNGSMVRPSALQYMATLDGRMGAHLDPCAAVQVIASIPPGATVDVVFLLGEAVGEEKARSLCRAYATAEKIEAALEEVQGFWRQLVCALQVTTPCPAIDLMLNGWLLYQVMSCRLWGRSAFYQSGGAFGFRDQLQDSTALIYSEPQRTRNQILLHAAHQFEEGDVLHWWHPPGTRGIRTRFSDDLLWLPFVTCFYVGVTGDHGILDERLPFLTDRRLAPGEDEAFLVPRQASEGDLYTHCCRAIDRSLAVGAHGLPLMGTGDWNDGMNRVGRGGRGESVWLGFFLYEILADMAELCDQRGDDARAQRYRAHREGLRQALEEAGWDGEWYRRAYYDDGTPLGSAQNDECRIDALAQAWAVLSGAGPRSRSEQAMDAVEQHLVNESAGLIHLLMPPFDRTDHDPGYIKGYVPGIRENGGQYTHAALWVVRALAQLGRRERAARLLEMLSPASRGGMKETISTYRAEPYVVAADVYGVAPHLGRGGWTWYTGSAAWMYRVGIESILGLQVEGGDRLCIRPCIPDSWPEFRIDYCHSNDGTRYEIHVRNPEGRPDRVVAAEVDGEPVPVSQGAAVITFRRDGRPHRASVVLGPKDAGSLSIEKTVPADER